MSFSKSNDMSSPESSVIIEIGVRNDVEGDHAGMRLTDFNYEISEIYELDTVQAVRIREEPKTVFEELSIAEKGEIKSRKFQNASSAGFFALSGAGFGLGAYAITRDSGMSAVVGVAAGTYLTFEWRKELRKRNQKHETRIDLLRRAPI